jgi:hypothetical protein
MYVVSKLKLNFKSTIFFCNNVGEMDVINIPQEIL